MTLKDTFQNTTKAIKKLLKPEMGEMSRSGNDVWNIRNLPVYNEDDLIGRFGLDVYKKMQQTDGQVKAIFMLKKHARLSTPWDIRPEDEDDKDAVEQAEFISHCFSEMKGNINNSLLKIWNAMRDGYSISEINYKIIPSGEFKGKIGIDNIKTRKAKNYAFECDEHGNVREEGLIEAGKTHLPINKFILFTYNPNDDDSDSLYGESDFRAAYRYYFSNDVIQRFWNIYLEKFGQPTIIGRYPVGTTRAKQDEYLDILKNIQTDTAIVMPTGLEAELLEATRRGDAGYKEAFNTNNAMIARALLVGTLLMDTGEQGSWALSKTHFDIFIYILDYLGKETEDTIIREQIIKRLIDFNFPNPRYPYFKFESLIKDDQKAKADVAKILVDAGLINPEEEWVREFLKIPAKEEGIVLPEPKPKGGLFTVNYQTKLSRQPNQYEKKCNFTRIIKSLDSFEEKAKEELREILIWQKEALKKSITRAEIMESQNAREVEKLQLSYVGEFRDCVKGWLQELFRYGMSEVESELKINKFVGLPAEKAMQYLKNKAFWIAGVTRDAILKDAKGILYTGMKNGSTTTEIMFLLDQFFKKFIGTPGVETREGKLLTPYHLENIIRTNFSDAFNQGRQDMMEDPDVKDIMAGEMFSAIMDDRTTEVCEALDGQVFEQGDPDIARFTPPLHYMCFPADIKVTTYKNNGRSRTKKRIENINIGDIVLTQNDEKHKVISKFEREYKGELIVIEMDNGNILKATPNHPIYTKNRGWIKAEDLKTEDILQNVPNRAYFKKYQYLKEKDNLEDLYINQRKTLRQIAKIYNVGSSTVNHWMKKLGIELRHGSEAIKTQWENNDKRREQTRIILSNVKKRPDYIYYWEGKKRPDISLRLKKCNHLLKPEVIVKSRKSRMGMMRGANNPMYGKQSPHGKGMWYKTPYNKIVFMRSKWEIKVANYLTFKRLKWEYEPERYNLGDRTYLPDFKIFTKNSFYLIEVKGWFHKRHQETIRLFRKIYPNIPLILWNKKCMEMAGIL